MCGLRAVTNIKDFSISSLILCSLAFIPTTQFLVNEFTASLNNLIDLKTLEMMAGLKTFNYIFLIEIKLRNFKVPIGSSNCNCGMISHNLRAHHCNSFALSGIDLINQIVIDLLILTFPGMIEEPGSFSGKISSPMPHLGPDPITIFND